MRRLIEKLGVVRVGFICVFAMMFICTLCIVSAIESLENTIRETNESSIPAISMSYEEPEEVIVPVVYEKEASGSSIYTFGNMADKFYLTIMINEEQGLYVYDAPNMCENRIYCDSLAELEEWIACHLDQAWHDARFVMEWRY